MANVMEDRRDRIDFNNPDADLANLAREHVWIHSARWSDMGNSGPPRVIERGEGAALFDTEGNRYFDALSGLYVTNVGHGRAEIGQAMAEQAARLAYVSSATMTTRPAVELAEKIAAYTPGNLNRIFFCSGGSEAVESAMKIAKQLQQLRGFKGRTKVIARKGGYHGATFGAMSISYGRDANSFAPFMEGVSFIASPNRFANEFGLSGEEGDIRCAQELEREILEQGPETVAAFIGEPVSVANGLHVPSPAYWKEIRRICDHYGVLLIADEVICGFGRTGTMFACEQFGLVPDLMTMAKGITSGYAPAGAVAVKDDLYEEFKKKDARLSHLLTFGGQAVAAAAALKNIEIIEREKLAERSARMENFIRSNLDELKKHPTVADVRGIGMLFSIQLVKDKQSMEAFPSGLAAGDVPFVRRVAELMVSGGVLTRVVAQIQIVPPLISSEDELRSVFNVIDRALTIGEQEFGMV